MNERRPLNVNACNFEQFRQTAVAAEANFAALFDEIVKLRAEFVALLDRLGQSGAGPT